MKNPCKDCTNRCVGCHATCTSYIEWKRLDGEKKSKIREEQRHRWLLQSPNARKGYYDNIKRRKR